MTLPYQLTLRRLPMAVAFVVVFGAVIGPVVALTFGWLFQTGSQHIGDDPASWLLHAAGDGIAYALVFGFVCGFPIGYVRRRLSNLPKRQALILVTLTGMIAGACATIAI